MVAEPSVVMLEAEGVMVLVTREAPPTPTVTTALSEMVVAFSVPVTVADPAVGDVRVAVNVPFPMSLTDPTVPSDEASETAAPPFEMALPAASRS